MSVEGQSGGKDKGRPVNAPTVLLDSDEEVHGQEAGQAEETVHPGLLRVPDVEWGDRGQCAGDKPNFAAEQLSAETEDETDAEEAKDHRGEANDERALPKAHPIVQEKVVEYRGDVCRCPLYSGNRAGDYGSQILLGIEDREGFIKLNALRMRIAGKKGVKFTG